ncbi:flagellin [Geothrix sp. PMB-07]|uniref:flagellin N-terminal helical domain-containing protein n=1 Tax=Geothrix sp. PMB-07 TaxID=3068640 RepID=UPI0027415928|nr:flagellin [Geothrix sp. PMB-07]WLT32928.1 flagellin [Geothrix sp. PMB-07]
MALRTPSTNQTQQSLLALQRTKERLALNQTRISTGNRLTGPGDDPTASAAVLSLGNSIDANTQFIKQADSALGYLSMSEDVVAAAIERVQRLGELAAEGGSAASSEVDSIRTALIDLANTKGQGKFLFAGTATQGTAAHPLPFEDAAPPAGPINYWGNAGSISLNVTNTTVVATNLPGDSVFFGSGGQGSSTDIFKVVTDLRDGLATNNAALTATATTNLTACLDSLTKAQVDLGGKQSQLLALKDTLSGFNVSLQGLQNTQQDTDYPQAATEYASDQVIQSASLSVLAKVNKTNLFDYLA